MEKKMLVAIAFLLALALAIYYLQAPPPMEIIGVQTVTGTVTLQPCPLNPTVNVYALQTAEGTIYYIYPDFYIVENSPEAKPFLKENMGKTITIRGEIVKINGQLHIRTPQAVVS